MSITSVRHRDSLVHFAGDVERFRAVYHDERRLAVAIARRLDRLLCDPDWLDDAYRQPGDACYRQHLLYVAPDGGFSVVSLVWKPGQATPVHDHVAWCIVGVLQGEECETRYHLYENENERFLVADSCSLVIPGHATILLPPDEDIHKVACVGNGTAISIHVYGADVGTRGTSINHRFDDVPIHSHARGAVPVQWRQGSRSLESSRPAQLVR